MFSSAAHSAVHFARRTIFATLCKQARFLSVSTVSSTKNFYSESVLFSEKPSKASKNKKIDDKKSEQSQLYPNEWEKLSNYDLMEEYDLLMDDETPSMQKDQRSGKLENVAGKSEAVDKMPSMQKVERSVRSESVTGKSEAVDKMPSMQKVERSFWRESVAGKSEAVEEVKIPQKKEIELKENDLFEKLSDSDSDSDIEDCFSGMRKRGLNNFQVNNLNITRLGRRSKFLREEMGKATAKEDGMVFNDEIGGIFALAKLGVIPEALFVCSPEALRYFPAELDNIALYTIPLEDMRYWVTKVRKPGIAMIGLYREENLRIKTSSSEPGMPLTIICDQIWHRNGFAQLINSAYITPPKLFITSKDCANPWHGIVVRNTTGHGMLLNHDFGLSWEEIRQKVDEKDRVYVLDLQPPGVSDESGTEFQWPSLPSVNLYNHSFWDEKNITLVVTASQRKTITQELSRFCFERKASRIDVGVTKRLIGLIPFQMVFFEIRRQWLAAGNRNLCKSGSKNGKTAKSRVRIVSTLFKT